MAKGNYYCEECVEEISVSDVFWESGRPYCGRCGGELDMDTDTADVVDHMSSQKIARPMGTDYDDGTDDDEDDDLDANRESDLDDEADDEDEDDDR